LEISLESSKVERGVGTKVFNFYKKTENVNLETETDVMGLNKNFRSETP
jgi:hypothetical protein